MDLHVCYQHRTSNLTLRMETFTFKYNINQNTIKLNRKHCSTEIKSLPLHLSLEYRMLFLFAYYRLNFHSILLRCYLSQCKFECILRYYFFASSAIFSFRKPISGVKQANREAEKLKRFQVKAMVSVNSFTEIEDIVQQNQQSLCTSIIRICYFL